MPKTSHDVYNLLVNGPDDVACRWLCMSAGQRSRAEEEGIVMALDSMPYCANVVPLSFFPDAHTWAKIANE